MMVKQTPLCVGLKIFSLSIVGIHRFRMYFSSVSVEVPDTDTSVSPDTGEVYDPDDTGEPNETEDTSDTQDTEDTQYQQDMLVSVYVRCIQEYLWFNGEIALSMRTKDLAVILMGK